jgi:hypothetical protein
MRVPLAMALCLVPCAVWTTLRAHAEDGVSATRVRLTLECDASDEARVRAALRSLPVTVSPPRATPAAKTQGAAKTYGIPAAWPVWQALLRAASSSGVTLERVAINPSRATIGVQASSLAAVELLATALRGSTAITQRARDDQPISVGKSSRDAQGIRSNITIHFARSATYEPASHSTAHEFSLAPIEALVLRAGAQVRRASSANVNDDKSAGIRSHWRELVLSPTPLEKLEALIVSIERVKGYTVHDIRYSDLKSPVIRVGFWQPLPKD